MTHGYTSEEAKKHSCKHEYRGAHGMESSSSSIAPTVKVTEGGKTTTRTLGGGPPRVDHGRLPSAKGQASNIAGQMRAMRRR